MCILVGRGVGDRLRLLRLSGERDLPLFFSVAGAGLRLSTSFVSFASLSLSRSLSFLSLSF